MLYLSTWLQLYQIHHSLFAMLHELNSLECSEHYHGLHWRYKKKKEGDNKLNIYLFLLYLSPQNTTKKGVVVVELRFKKKGYAPPWLDLCSITEVLPGILRHSIPVSLFLYLVIVTTEHVEHWVREREQARMWRGCSRWGCGKCVIRSHTPSHALHCFPPTFSPTASSILPSSPVLYSPPPQPT